MKMVKLISFCCLVVFLVSSFAIAEEEAAPIPEKVIKEMVIHVDSKIIALPGNKATKVPISLARVRSTELRDLNGQYGAKSIEKIFKVKNNQSEIIEQEYKSSYKKEKLEGVVDLATVFTRDIKKEMEEKGHDVVQVKDVFLIVFEFDSEVSMGEIVNAYKDVSVVKFAEQIERTK
ncbi:MAG: hypothetical protein GY853_13120 [PVC group bacterium]|nr:hypothetical protein [PVC group bacterium]